MAILLDNGNYLKLEKDGSYKLYNRKEDRDNEKNGIDHDTIESIYNSLINSFVMNFFINKLGISNIGEEKNPNAVLRNLTARDVYRLKTEYPNDYEYFEKLRNEYSEFTRIYTLGEKESIDKLTILSEYIDNIEDCIIDGVHEGRYPLLASDTVEEAYEKLKSGKFITFGCTCTDC